MTAEQLRTARRVPRAKTLRRALGLTQEEFAARFLIPLGYVARLGTGSDGTGPASPCLSTGDRRRRRGRDTRTAGGAVAAALIGLP